MERERQQVIRAQEACKKNVCRQKAQTTPGKGLAGIHVPTNPFSILSARRSAHGRTAVSIENEDRAVEDDTFFSHDYQRQGTLPLGRGVAQ